MNILEELEWRGLIADCTDRTELEKRTTSPLTLYCGFDPTADSLHAGNLVPLLGLRRFQLLGHHPIAVAGGATGSIGDPSGKTAERQLLTKETIATNIASVKEQLRRLLDFDTKTNPARLVDNASWTANVTYLDFLRDIGKHFSVNHMIGKESVRARMEDREVGISYTEFSYMLLQAFDFYVITNADGTKFGKTEAGAVWLEVRRTSVYKFYQYWIRTDDRDVVRYLKYFAFLPREEIEALEHQHAGKPEGRAGHKALAKAVTDLVHGPGATAEAIRASEILFGGGLDGISEGTFNEIVGEVPTKQIEKARLDGSGWPLVEGLVHSGLCPSKGQARKDIEGGGVYLNNVREGNVNRAVMNADLLFGKHLLLRKGKRNYVVVIAK